MSPRGFALDKELDGLIKRSIAGDEAAFGVIFHQYKNLVFKTAYLMLGDAHESEDILQEVFIKLHKSLHTYDPSRGAFTTWLHRVTINACVGFRRQRKMWLGSLEEMAARVLHFEPVARVEEKTDEAVLVWRSISRLSPKLRAVMVLRYYWDLSYAEIAQVLQVPLGTVKSRINLGVQTLRLECAETADEGEPMALPLGATGKGMVSRGL